jgi:hypothetical protein
MTYINTNLEKLKIKFDGAEEIENNHSQAFQDLFVLTMLNGKRNGIYVEIGGADPIDINNTYILERNFNWTGVSFEIDEEVTKDYNTKRVNRCYCLDATTADYTKIFEENKLLKHMDYLQVDIEPAWQTLKSLKQIDLDTYRFSVITFETDAYYGNNLVISESREILKNHGYQLVASNVKNSGNPFEDWYVDPKVIPETIWKQFICDNLEASEVIYK